MASNTVREVRTFGHSIVQIGNTYLIINDMPSRIASTYFGLMYVSSIDSCNPSPDVLDLTTGRRSDLHALLSYLTVTDLQSAPLAQGVHRQRPSPDRVPHRTYSPRIRRISRCYRCDRESHEYSMYYALEETVDRGREARKRDGRCLYCGDEDHWQDDCPRRVKSR
ncbi:hypothetical protein F5Y16DRAFT_109359 [Xylariaceae sp. FL0255]|nr:hypothetical protein F5Y16DRAFT_109359 [Xylariaceae sp. FL0255]